MSAQLSGVVLVCLGVAIALFGDKAVDAKGGSISRLFSMSTLHAKVVKWAAALLLIVSGAVLMLGAGRL